MSEHSPRPALSPVVAGCWRLAEWGWSAPERLRWIDVILGDVDWLSFDGRADLEAAVQVRDGEVWLA